MRAYSAFVAVPYAEPGVVSDPEKAVAVLSSHSRGLFEPDSSACRREFRSDDKTATSFYGGRELALRFCRTFEAKSTKVPLPGKEEDKTYWAHQN